MTKLKTFTEEIKSSQEGIYLVTFGAPWCESCKQLETIMEAIIEEGYSVFEVNIDEKEELIEKYEIRNVPTTVFFKNKEQVQRIIGIKTKEDFINLLKSI